MDSTCCTLSPMDLDYTPTPAESAMAHSIDRIVDRLMEGQLTAVGLCAVDVDGDPAFFYLNTPEEPVLRPALNKLMGLYEAGMQFKKQTNAPRTNRSYLEH